jgi:hypothetical protein
MIFQAGAGSSSTPDQEQGHKESLWWNGDVLLHAHGCRPEGIELVADLPMENDECYRRLVAEEGWVVAMTSYRKQGLVVREAIWDLVNLREFVVQLMAGKLTCHQRIGSGAGEDGGERGERVEGGVGEGKDNEGKEEEQEGKRKGNDSSKAEEPDLSATAGVVPRRIVLEGESMGGAIVTFICERREAEYRPVIVKVEKAADHMNATRYQKDNHFITFDDASGSAGLDRGGGRRPDLLISTSTNHLARFQQRAR